MQYSYRNCFKTKIERESREGEFVDISSVLRHVCISFSFYIAYHIYSIPYGVYWEVVGRTFIYFGSI